MTEIEDTNVIASQPTATLTASANTLIYVVGGRLFDTEMNRADRTIREDRLTDTMVSKFSVPKYVVAWFKTFMIKHGIWTVKRDPRRLLPRVISNLMSGFSKLIEMFLTTYFPYFFTSEDLECNIGLTLDILLFPRFSIIISIVHFC